MNIYCPNCYNNSFQKAGFYEGHQRWKCKACKQKTIYPIEDLELITENVKLAKQKQSYQDINRIERKAFREYARVENAVEKYCMELVEIFEKKSLSKLTIEHDSDNKAVGVIQFSDVHFNEIVDLEHNKYDFKVASQRLYKFAQRIKELINLYKIEYKLN